MNATTAAYIECALWSETDWTDGDANGVPLDQRYGPDDLAPETLASMTADCADFLAVIDRENIDTTGWTAEQLGHDLWLTRNRHGAGFWDRYWKDGDPRATVGDLLTKHAHAYGETSLYVGDDGRLYVTP